MKTSIGKYSKSFFLKLLVGIIILPFIFWGMGDVFRGGNQNIVATVDSEKINTQSFINYLNRLNLDEQARKNIDKSDLVEKILSDYIGKKIVEIEMNRLGINITDATLKNIITNDENFLKKKKFSRVKYELFLLQSSLTAVQFEQNIVTQEKKRQLL
ncbi:SurA N-terminal domain-containing protein, partial [Pelagibacteraceae bacterium]|nr:SurA N-terminal domain-containing protein [Pelagibacteraceae bacterium]